MVLLDAASSEQGGSRLWLSAQAEALCEVPGMKQMLLDATHSGSGGDLAMLFGAEVVEEEGGVVVVTFPQQVGQFDRRLGGDRRPGERSRRVRVELSSAKWRDTFTKKIRRVTVSSDAESPTPTAGVGLP